MPVTGEIIAINEALEDTPEIVNEDPYGEGWFIRIRADSLDEIEGLLDAEAYRSRIESQS